MSLHPHSRTKDATLDDPTPPRRPWLRGRTDAGRGPSQERIADGLLLGCCAIAAFVSLLLLLTFGYGRDHGIYAAVADAMLRGGAPYRDAWDFKTPGIYLVFALARLGGSEVVAVRVLESLAWSSLVVAYAIHAKRHVGTCAAGLVGGCLAVVVHVQQEFWHTAQPEGFAAPLVAWALVCATYRAATNDPRAARLRWAAWAAMGALYAAAGLLKPPLAGGMVVSWAILAAREARTSATPLRTRLWAVASPTIAIGGGACAVAGATLVYFLALGALDEMVEVLTGFTPRYTALGFEGGRLPASVLAATHTAFGGFSFVPFVGVLLAVGTASERDEREGMAHVAGALGAALVGVALQAKGIPYHYSTALALLGLLAGWGYWKAWRLARKRARTWFPFLVGLAVLVHARPPTRGVPGDPWLRVTARLAALTLAADERRALLDRLDSAPDMPQPWIREAAQWLERATPRDATVFVWGFEPQIYAYAGRQPASRYVYDVPQRAAWSRDEHRPKLMADLARSRPAAILVERDDRFPWVTGNADDSLGELDGFPELRRFLAEQYVRIGGNARFEYHRRR